MILGLTIYALVILVRNFVEGLRAVAVDVTLAASAMGYRPTARLFAVDLPLALPAFVAGLRVAAVSTISLVSVGAVIGTGGLGQLFIHGFQIDNPIEIWAGIVATVVLALVVDLMMVALGRVHPVGPGGPLMGDDQVASDASVWSGPDGIPTRLLEHIWYSGLAVLIAVLIALPVGMLIGHTGRGNVVAATVSNVWRALPTFGLVILVFRLAPLSIWPVLAALVVIAVPPILLNTDTGIRSIDDRP